MQEDQAIIICKIERKCYLMTTTKKWRGTYVKLPLDAANALLALEKETGKSKTRIIADFLTGERQFRPDVER